ncbi:unnamed protein product [Caenorhabditis auriculariae]|uniref:SSD domain-containing protein n=1 Tax=Caenorhabditis auriculariae TaxID=2777116 RepID=A0A8S1GNE0_9PELO|nr:unnamed protein product [Caenorhabditis auriculariae]
MRSEEESLVEGRLSSPPEAQPTTSLALPEKYILVNGNSSSKEKSPTRFAMPKKKTWEFFGQLRESASITHLFEALGRLIGEYPLAFLLVTVLMLLQASGIYGMRLRDNLRDGYTPTSSDAMQENKVYRDFLRTEGDPVMTTLLFIAKDGGSMHRLEYLAEAVKSWHHISQKMTVNVDEIDVKYEKFCGNYCDVNRPVEIYVQAAANKTWNPKNKAVDLQYPIANIQGFRLHLERNFFGVKTDGNYSIEDVSNIKHIELVSMMIMAEVKNLEEFQRIGKWELELFEYCRNYTASKETIIELQVIGSEIVDTEMNKDAQRMAPYFVWGVSMMGGMMLLCMCASCIFYGFSMKTTPIVFFVTNGVPFFSIISTFGLMNFLGYRINSPMMIMPFLIMGIGVNDSLLALQSLMQQNHKIPVEAKMERALGSVGPSIVVTTMTNVATFLIGWASPTEEISIFCMGCAIAMSFAFLYTLTFFCPIMAIVLKSDWYRVSDYNPDNSRLHRLAHSLSSSFSKLIVSNKTFYVTLALTILFWIYAGIGVVNINAKLDTGKILPLDSPIRRPNRLIEEIVWTEFYPVTVIVNNELDLKNDQQMALFDDFVKDFESLPNCRGSEFTISWLRDYKEYFFGIGAEDFDYDSDIDMTKPQVFDYSKLLAFLASPIHKHYLANVRVAHRGKEVAVTNFTMTFVYQNSSSWEDRINIMNQWRSIIKKHPELNASVWNVNALFVDQMQSLKRLAIVNMFTTLLCMLAVCVIFISNLASIGVAIVAIMSIALGVVGYASHLGLDLDPVTLCATIISVGMAVDFVAHPAYHYQVKHVIELRNGREVRVRLKTPYERVYHSVSMIAWPMCQAAASTLLCVLPVIFLQNYLPLVFVKIISLVVSIGIAHGLFVVPVFLAQIPLTWFDNSIFQLIVGKDHVGDVSDDDVSLEDEVAAEELAIIGTTPIQLLSEATPLSKEPV